MGSERKYTRTGVIWQERLQNGDYKNWLKVGYGLHITCAGIRPHIEQEAKAFHQTLMAKGMTRCMCVYVTSRKPSPHHDMSLCDWAKELKKHHNKKNPTWSQSDSTKWTDPVAGPWEVAKLFMPFGCAVGSTSADDTDATGLLNLLEFCDHYKVNTTNVQRLKKTRNAWAHASQQELTESTKRNAFTCMKEILLDNELRSDVDAQNALKTLTDFENQPLIDSVEEIEEIVNNHLMHYMKTILDELMLLKDSEETHAIEMGWKLDDVMRMQLFCAQFEEQRQQDQKDQHQLLVDIQHKIDDILCTVKRDPQQNMKPLRILDWKSIWSEAVVQLLNFFKSLPASSVLWILFLLHNVVLLEEDIHDIASQGFIGVGCFYDSIQDRALPDLIANFRIQKPYIDWSNITKTIYHCAKAAQSGGYVYFGIQFWGECWASHTGHVTYDKHGGSKSCRLGVGEGYTNYVYRNTGVENECGSYNVLDEPDRAMTYQNSSASYRCDSHLVSGWYRFQGGAGDAMANTCVPQSSCTTLVQGWVKGDLPNPAQGIEDAKVCYRFNENCCRWNEPIKVRNCGRFYVYKLNKPLSGACNLRYCGNGI